MTVLYCTVLHVQAIHVFVESEGALVQHPVLVTVKQPRGVRAWSLPHVDSG